MNVPTAHVIAAAGHIKKLALVIAVIGTVASYGTQVGLLMNNGFFWLFAGLIPATVDILAIAAAMALQLPGLPAGDRKIAGVVLTIAVAMSGTANIVGAHNFISGVGHAWPVIAYLFGELIANRVRAYAAKLEAEEAAKTTVAMVAKDVADAQMATAMAKAAADMAAAVAATEARLQAEVAELVAEAERATREAIAAEHQAQQQEARKAAEASAAARADAERIAREQATAERLAKSEAERLAMAKQLADAAASGAAKPAAKSVAKSVAKPAMAKPASDDELANARVANGAASAVAMAILATDLTLSDEDVVRVATERGEVTSTRTARRVRAKMLATAAA